jgi:uncharacterized membrane protein
MSDLFGWGTLTFILWLVILASPFVAWVVFIVWFIASIQTLKGEARRTTHAVETMVRLLSLRVAKNRERREPKSGVVVSGRSR